MRTAGSVLTLLTVAASASWWQPSPPPIQAATPCPGGAEFKYEQVWTSGFRAVVTMSRWIPGRRVIVHFDEGELPGLRSYGAELLDTTATTATFSLGSTPGKSAADSFDLQGRGKPPKASAVRISCELPYPPPPPTPSKPPAPVDGCAEYAHTLEVTEEWEGGYTLQVTLSSSLPHSIAPNLEVGLNFSVAALGKEQAKAAGTGVVSVERSNRRASLAPSPPSPMSAAATAVSTGKVVMRLQELRGAQLVAESRKRGVISVLVTPLETLNGGSSDVSADTTDARRSSTTYRFDMDVLASHERPPRITCSERWPSPQPYIPPLPPFSPPAPSPEPPLVPAPPFPPSPSPPPYPIFQCGEPESRYSFDAIEAGSSTSNVLEAASLLQLSSQQNMPESGVYTASVHRLPGTNWPAAEHGLLTIRFAEEESTVEIMDVRGGTLFVPPNEEPIGNPTKELVFDLRGSLRREELHFSSLHRIAHSCPAPYVYSDFRTSVLRCSADSTASLYRSCRDYAESAASCEAHYERAGSPLIFITRCA
ncbi:hypothetical protein AB1Y20_014455 [Prymnesium parvum]|uniref:Uncharacterized protein n=1 Tax=Prymnesium parvum TaxID=97485 RepID=A0AB34IGM7_PRYPA